MKKGHARKLKDRLNLDQSGAVQPSRDLEPKPSSASYLRPLNLEQYVSTESTFGHLPADRVTRIVSPGLNLRRARL